MLFVIRVHGGQGPFFVVARYVAVDFEWCVRFVFIRIDHVLVIRSVGVIEVDVRAVDVLVLELAGARVAVFIVGISVVAGFVFEVRGAVFICTIGQIEGCCVVVVAGHVVDCAVGVLCFGLGVFIVVGF